MNEEINQTIKNFCIHRQRDFWHNGLKVKLDGRKERKKKNLANFGDAKADIYKGSRKLLLTVVSLFFMAKVHSSRNQTQDENKHVAKHDHQ